MTILVIDTDAPWLAHCRQQGADTCGTLDAALVKLATKKYKRVIVSSLLLDIVPALVRAGARVEVVTNQPTPAGKVAAYDAGAMGYWVKDWGKSLC